MARRDKHDFDSLEEALVSVATEFAEYTLQEPEAKWWYAEGLDVLREAAGGELIEEIEKRYAIEFRIAILQMMYNYN